MTTPALDSDGGALQSRLSARQRVIALTAVVFVAVMLLSSPVPGINEPHYLCKARAAVDPSWCAPDFFLHSTNAHVVFLTVTGWLTQWCPLAVVAAAGRMASAVLLACGWQRLARSVGLAPSFQLPAAAGLATLVQLGSFSGEWLLGGFEAKVPAWAFCVGIRPAPRGAGRVLERTGLPAASGGRRLGRSVYRAGGSPSRTARSGASIAPHAVAISGHARGSLRDRHAAGVAAGCFAGSSVAS
jgi:hypothetical protein